MKEIPGAEVLGDVAYRVTAVRTDGPVNCGFSSVTPGKVYPITADVDWERDDRGAWIESDIGEPLYIVFGGCAHLGGDPWTCIVEDEDD